MLSAAEVKEAAELFRQLQEVEGLLQDCDQAVSVTIQVRNKGGHFRGSGYTFVLHDTEDTGAALIQLVRNHNLKRKGNIARRLRQLDCRLPEAAA